MGLEVGVGWGGEEYSQVVDIDKMIDRMIKNPYQGFFMGVGNRVGWENWVG